MDGSVGKLSPLSSAKPLGVDVGSGSSDEDGTNEGGLL